jgi:CTP synthase
MPTKYIFVTGGVISGLGKGISTASIALLLKSAGYKVSVLKVDMYLNIDAGTMNPLEHGEVFVTDDGLETDQDLGNYERFLSQTLHRHNYMTMGQVYWEVLNKERSLGYKGATVQGHIHVPEAIIEKITNTGKKDKADIVLIEVGGTVGEYQNVMFFEAIRRFKQKYPKNVFIIHLVYLLMIDSLGELKSKPAQASIYELYKLGLHPDMIVCRSKEAMDEKRKERISFNTGIDENYIIKAQDVKSIYEIPIIFEEQKVHEKLLKLMSLKTKSKDLKNWEKMLANRESAKKEIKIAIVGKYFTSGSYSLEDAYVCVIEAIKHASWAQNVKPVIKWLDVENYKLTQLKEFDGVIIPQGWGSRGVEGKIKAIEFLRKNKIPYLGLCFGMQMAAIEYARNVLKLKDANSEEADPNTPNPIIHIMPNQKEYLGKNQYGGTIRLGSWPCKVKENSLLEYAYKKFGKDDIEKGIINERHRHRYEVNNEYKEKLIEKGLIISGTSPDGKLAEVVELPKSVHPFFLGTQFHPEYKSWPLKPHPLFMAFIEACLKD